MSKQTNKESISLKTAKENALVELNFRLERGMLPKTNYEFLVHLINKADDESEVRDIIAMGTYYKRTGLHYDSRLELRPKKDNYIRYIQRNEELSFDNGGIHHKLIIGDNYPALQNLLVSYRNRIDVIYIDPPYGCDNMNNAAKTNYTNNLSRDILLSQLHPRLLLAKDLLSAEGVIFCSIDDKNYAYVKCLMDEVFGEQNCVSTCVWQKKTGANDAHGIAIIAEYILVYCKETNKLKWNEIFTQNYDSYDVDRYKKQDEYFDVRGAYYEDNLDRGGLRYSDSMNYGITCPDGTVTFPNGNTTFKREGWTWKWSEDKVKWGIKNGFIVFKESSKKKSGWGVYYKNYVNVDNEGKIQKRFSAFKNIITGILNSDGTREMNSLGLNDTFKNPKPVALIKSLIRIATNNKENAIILDFYAGSGTTGQAVLEINKEDNKKHQYILCTINEKTEKNPNGIAYDVTSKRMKRIMTGTCYDNTSGFEWLNKNKPYGDSLDVYNCSDPETGTDISVLANTTDLNNTPFDVIDETAYGLDKFANIQDKVKWVCENFEKTCSYLPKQEEV